MTWKTHENIYADTEKLWLSIGVKQLQSAFAKRKFIWKYEWVDCVPSHLLLPLSQQIIFQLDTG